MAKITFPVATTSDYLSTFNQNFVDIAAELQNKVAYRANPAGETNTITNDWDMDGNRVFNLPIPSDPSEAARLQDIINATAGIVPATAIPFAPAGTIASTNVQDAIEELDTETQLSFANLYSEADVSKGAQLIGYLPPWTGAVGRSVSEHLQDFVSARTFGLHPSNTGAQNNTAMAAAIAFAIAQGGLTIHIPRGVYDFASSIIIAGAPKLRITGDGVDATVLRITHATLDFIVAGGDFYQTIDNLTLTSSVTRTAGAMFIANGFWSRGLIDRVKISNHFDGIELFQFEACTLSKVNIVSPTGNGTALIVGNPALTNQGANLTLNGVFIRGNDETNPVSAAVGRWGIYIYDIEAIYGFDVDLSIFTDQAVVIEPTFQTANCFFTSCYFDATVGGDNILVKGAGHKNRFEFTGCWFATAGRYGVGAQNCAGVHFSNNGTYTGWIFTGCEFIGTSGPGLIVFTPEADITITGGKFDNCGVDTTLPTSVHIAPVGVQTKGVVASGIKFTPFGTSTADFNINLNGRLNTITGCEFLRGITHAAGATFGNVSGNSDVNTTDTIASAGTLLLNATKNFYTITGTTNVGGLFKTFTGHTVTFVATGAFTWQNGGALVLAGGANFVTAAGSTITLINQPGATAIWREISRHA